MRILAQRFRLTPDGTGLDLLQGRCHETDSNLMAVVTGYARVKSVCARTGIGNVNSLLKGWLNAPSPAAAKNAPNGSLWDALTRATIARYARGNISVQNARILLPAQQDQQRERIRATIVGWRQRAK
jgi:hypothetical protein